MPYEPTATLSGHTDSVRVLRFSPHGNYLASGGDDGLILVFSTDTWRMVAKIVNVSPVTALLWHSAFPKTIMCGFHSGAVVTICLDSGDRDVAGRKIWTDTFNGPIKCVTSHPFGKTFAIAHGGDVTLLDQTTISTWENLRKLPDPPEFSRNLPSPSVRATHFTRNDRIIVCYLDHGIVCWDLATLGVLWRIRPRTCNIGYSAISPDEKHLAVSNLFDGLDWYSITEHKLSHSVPCPINLQNNVPIPVRFGADGGIIIVGGSSGNARILDSMTAETMQTLSHDGDFIQALDYYTAEDVSTIATGVSELGTKTTVKIWKSVEEAVPQEFPPPGSREVETKHRSYLQVVIPILTVLLATVYHLSVTGSQVALQEKFGARLSAWRGGESGPEVA
ncbi:WD40-repeat-containing domain protein [Thelephora terrestris]|uniref:WD40-repeat-containing domain protein n=1 Tax=Thelephora terrestris TaxID=56493 RepID=A0A9P6L0Y4_9AGAM|nr:WD40-repeat-containing domain protein [Thelephora terrestris]